MKHKEQEKLDEDARRRPDAWERFRILAESIDQGRRVSEIADHKARYALVIIGVVNAAVIYLGIRSDFLSGSPLWLRPWLAALAIPYTVATLFLLWYAIDCLRPRTLAPAPRPMKAEPGNPSPGTQPLGVLVWEAIVRHDLAGYQSSWNQITLGQVNAELVIVAHTLAALIQAKYRAIQRMYRALLIVIALATTLLGFDAWFAFGR